MIWTARRWKTWRLSTWCRHRWNCTAAARHAPRRDDALSESAAKIARQEALFKAFEASGKSAREFADMYGVPERDVIKAGLACKRRAQAGAVEA